MPCGPRDRRRGSYRCDRCRRDHVKCNRERPCTSCKRKQVACISTSGPPCATLHIIQSHPVATWSIVRDDLISKSVYYTSAFFFAVGSSPVLTTVFSEEILTPLLHDNVLLQKTVSLVGGYYALGNPQLLSVSRTDRASLFHSLQILRHSVAARIQLYGNSNGSPVVVICALLLSFVELLVDPSGQLWESWICKIHAFVEQHHESFDFQNPLLKSVWRLAQIITALKAVCLQEKPQADVSAQLPQLGTRRFVMPSQIAPISAKLQDKLLDCFAQDLDMWAQIQWWAMEWESSSRQFSQNETLATEETLCGIDITCIASRFQRDLIDCSIWYSRQELGTFGTAMLALYQSMAIDTSHMFSHPCWLSLGCELPLMPHRLSYEQALSSLRSAEGTLEHLHLEAIIYAPILYAIGMEMARKSDKYRVLKFFSSLKGKGFRVTDRITVAVEEVWDTKCGDLKSVVACS